MVHPIIINGEIKTCDIEILQSFDYLDGHLPGPFWTRNGQKQTKEGCHTSSVGLKGRSSTWMSHVHERRDARCVWVMYC